MQLTEKLRTANVFDNAKFKYKLRANKKMNAHHNESLQIVEKSKQINKKQHDAVEKFLTCYWQ